MFGSDSVYMSQRERGRDSLFVSEFIFVEEECLCVCVCQKEQPFVPVCQIEGKCEQECVCACQRCVEYEGAYAIEGENHSTGVRRIKSECYDECERVWVCVLAETKEKDREGG